MVNSIEGFFYITVAAIFLIFNAISLRYESASKLESLAGIVAPLGILLCAKYSFVATPLFNEAGNLSAKSFGDQLFVFSTAFGFTALFYVRMKGLRDLSPSPPSSEEVRKQDP